MTYYGHPENDMLICCLETSGYNIINQILREVKMLLIVFGTSSVVDYNNLRNFFLNRRPVLLLVENMTSMTITITIEEKEIPDLASEMLSTVKFTGMVSVKETSPKEKIQ